MPTQTLRHTALLTGVKFWSINCLHFQVPKLKLLKVELSLEMYWNVFVKCRDNGHLMRAFFKNIPKNELWGIWGTSSSSYQAPFCHWVSLVHEFPLINQYFYKKRKILRHFKVISILGLGYKCGLQRNRDLAIMSPKSVVKCIRSMEGTLLFISISICRFGRLRFVSNSIYSPLHK